MLKENIYFILDKSQMANNVAQAARAMANFGFSRLRLVAPLNLPSAERMARGGGDVVKNAEIFETLPQALEGLTWVLGTTGKEDIGNEELVRPEEASRELAGLSAKGKVGIVFGCENHGLTNGQLRTLDRLAHVPTQEDCASINLAQSVAIFSWELEKGGLGQAKPLDFGLPEHSTRQQLFLKLNHILESLEIFPEGRRSVLGDGLRQFFNRDPMNKKDLAMWLRALNLMMKKLGLAAPRLGTGGAAPAAPSKKAVEKVG